MSLRTQQVLAGAAIFVAMLIVMRGSIGFADGLDYFTDAAFPIDALVRGDLQTFAQNPGLMGDFSLFLRVPFVWLVFEQNLTVVYLVGALPCLAAVVILAAYLRRRMLTLGLPVAAALLVAVLAVVNPGTLRSMHWGHPEEFLGAALCVGAILAATRRHHLLAGVLLGLAIATKQWAVIAIIPTLLAAGGQRIRLTAIAGAIAIAIALPAVILQPDAVVATHTAITQAQPVVAPANVWWPFSSPRTAAEREAGARGFAAEIPTWLGTLTHPLIVLLGIPIGFVYWRRRKSFEPEDALGLFALLMLLRCVLDPWNIDYYHAPFLLSLLAWEALRRGGWPRVTLLASVALALTFPPTLDSMTQMSAESLRYCVTYLAWSLPLTAWLTLALFAPQRLERLGRALRARVGPRLTRGWSGADAAAGPG
ncbi:MAG: glycosyltransferase 87 family protein [Solirubrobacteraceae bacterium]|nr:glycosyltransferase 87 family protein [Solirubrobacteraceae bacterium]